MSEKRVLSKKTSICLLAGATTLLLTLLLFLNPIPQSQQYHLFADTKSWLGIPNASNVLSNLPFAFIGIWGLIVLFFPHKKLFLDNRERWPWITFSIGLFLTALGSAYYHLSPDNARLVWDRLPMTLVFMSLATALICERISTPFGLLAWPILIAIGFSSIVYWHHTNDLRPYLGVQLFTLLVMLLMLVTVSPYNRNWDLAVIIILFALARLFEFFDKEIYRLTANVASGHTLKHLAAALAALWLIRMISKRKIVTDEH
ncbi:MAG: ceramidase domain-containing protein [Parachlamydiaceae bacterium]|nr:ceramidase domain-containing protein [Parachlamydiaceae bacterium]